MARLRGRGLATTRRGRARQRAGRARLGHDERCRPRCGDWARLLAWHDRALRGLFAEYGGSEIDHAGDGFAVAFTGPDEALQCAVAIQRALAAQRRAHGFAPAVRIGVHRAQAVVLDGAYRGVGMHIAARIGAGAEGGEIAASAATVAALAVEVVSRSSVELKGVDAPVELVTIAW